LEFVAEESSLDIVWSPNILSLIYVVFQTSNQEPFFSGNFAAARLSYYLDIFSVVLAEVLHIRVFEVRKNYAKIIYFWAQFIGVQLIHSKCLKMNELLFVTQNILFLHNS
jgi:hypothetical protein